MSAFRQKPSKIRQFSIVCQNFGTVIVTLVASSTTARPSFATAKITFHFVGMPSHRYYYKRRRRRRRMLMSLMLLSSSRSLSYYYRNKLNDEGKQRRDRNLIRAALHDPSFSTWQKCFDCGDDGVLITVTGFNHDTFNFMLSLFEPLFSQFSPWCSQFGGLDGVNYRKLSTTEYTSANITLIFRERQWYLAAWTFITFQQHCQ